MEYELGLKELYDVTIKTTFNIEMNGKILEPGETVVAFDKIQIANFKEMRQIATARGGFDNRAQIWWETTKDVAISLSQGIFSKSHFAMMTNARLYKIEPNQLIMLNIRESLESDEQGIVTLQQTPSTPMFVYDANGNKLAYSYLGNKQLSIVTPYKSVNVDYYYEYNNGYSYIQIGEELTHGYFVLEGKTRVKDDITGNVKTGLLRIPKLRLVSDLSMRLGSNATPVLGSFDAIACPTGVKGNTTVMEIIFLNDDIDADI